VSDANLGVRLGIETILNISKSIWFLPILAKDILFSPILLSYLDQRNFATKIFLVIYIMVWSGQKLVLVCRYPMKTIFGEKITETYLPLIGQPKASNPNFVLFVS